MEASTRERRRTQQWEDEDRRLQRKFTTSAVAASMKSKESSSRTLQRKYSRRPTTDKNNFGSETSYANLSLVDDAPVRPVARSKPVGREYDAHVKLLLLGDSAVGKSSILLRFCGGTFDKEHVLTIGVDFKSRIVNCNGEKLKLQVWDTAGQERFRNLTPVYFRTAAGVLLVFDITSRKSFDNITNWMRDLDETAREEAFRVLVGNKCDLETERQVSAAEARDLARKFGVKYYETSAKDDVNIDMPFLEIARDVRIFQLDPSKQPPRVAGLTLRTEPKVHKGLRWKSCCAEM